jgi:hypothetical protein
MIDASKEDGLEINVDNTKYKLLSRHQNEGQNWDIQIVNIVLKRVRVQIFGDDSKKSKFYSEGN